MKKYAYFFIDDVIWVYRDITREKPASIFEQRLLKILKEAHDRYGLKVCLNSFYRTDYFYGDDEFSLADMTDAYKAEWEANADWLKIAYHAKQEFPDYPHINVNYDDMRNGYARFKKEVLRFAGEKSLSTAFTPHWVPVSKDGIRAMRDEGIKVINCTAGPTKEYNGDPASLPYGHAMRLLQNRKPETKIFYRDSRDVAILDSLCGHNHLTQEEFERTWYSKDAIYNEELDVYYKAFGNGGTLNLSPLEEIESDMSNAIGCEFACVVTHEQYAYPDYLAYQPNTREKIMEMCRVFEKNGCEYIFIEELFE